MHPNPDPVPRPAAAGVYPDFGALGGAGQLRAVIGALLTVVLVCAVLMMIVSAAAWAVSNAHGNYRAAAKARAGLIAALGAAALAGAATTWINFLIGTGSSL